MLKTILNLRTNSFPALGQGKPAHGSKLSLTRNIVSADKIAAPIARGAASDANSKAKTASIAHPSLSIGVLGAKGGAGSTTLCLNLALALAKCQFSTAVLDANLQQPDLAVLVGREPEHSIVEFIARIDNLDETIFQACSVGLAGAPDFERCSLLSGPASGKAATQANLTQLAGAITPLESGNDFVLVDLPKTLDRHLVTMLDRLDLVLLVLEGTLSSTAAAKRWLRVFAELGYAESKLSIVLNRSGAKTQGLEKDIPSLLNGKEIFKIPNAFHLNEECSTSGQAALLKTPRQKYSLAVLHLATKIQEFRARKTDAARAE